AHQRSDVHEHVHGDRGRESATLGAAGRPAGRHSGRPAHSRCTPRGRTVHHLAGGPRHPFAPGDRAGLAGPGRVSVKERDVSRSSAVRSHPWRSRTYRTWRPDCTHRARRPPSPGLTLLPAREVRVGGDLLPESHTLPATAL